MGKDIHFRRSTAILTLLAASLGGGVVAALMVSSRAGSPVQVVASAAGPSVVPPGGSYADMLEKVTPAIVSVYTTQVIKASEQQTPSVFSDPFFQQFFGPGFGRQFKPRDQKEHGLGSGVIVSKDGYIVTNNHVVENADEVKISLNDGREFIAKVIGTDPKSDIAIVKVDAKDLPVIAIADSDKIEVGDF